MTKKYPTILDIIMPRRYHLFTGLNRRSPPPQTAVRLVTGLLAMTSLP